MKARRTRAVLLAAPVLPLALLATLLLALASCAGAPSRRAGGPEAAAEVLAEGLRLIEAASARSLAEALRLLLGEAATMPAAGEQAALAATLYELLYPELGTGELPPPAAPYRGPYEGLLERAADGDPPAAVVRGTGLEREAAPRSAFLELVLPQVYLARLPAGRAPAAPRQALESLAEAEALNPDSVLPPYLSGRLHEAAGELLQAAESYRETLRRDPGFYPGGLRLASLLLRQGRAEEATGLLRQVRSLLPEDRSLETLLARAYLEAGELEQAGALVARALTRDPQDAQNLLLRARILYAQGAWAQALKPLGLLLYQHPDTAAAYLLGAEIHYQAARDPEAALELLAEAQARFPGDARFFEASGRILMAEERSAEGLKELQKALDLEPGRVSTLRLLLADAVRMKRWLQAAGYVAEILEREESAADLRQAWEIYSGLGDNALALEYAERLYRSQPDEANRVLYARALVQHGGAGQRAAAGPLVEEALVSTQDPALRSRLYVLRARLAVGEEALADLRRALLADADNVEAMRLIAAAYLDRRLLREAALYLKRAAQLDPQDAGLRLQLEQVERTLAAQAP